MLLELRYQCIHGSISLTGGPLQLHHPRALAGESHERRWQWGVAAVAVAVRCLPLAAGFGPEEIDQGKKIGCVGEMDRKGRCD